MHRFLTFAAALLCCLFSAASGSVDMCPPERLALNQTWYYFNGWCYSLSTDREGWFGSEKACQKLGGHLTSISDQAENNFIHALTQCAGNFWIGMVKTAVSGPKLSWWDDQPANYTAPLGYYTGNYYDCVYFVAGNVPARWYNTYCQTQMEGVCKVQPRGERDSLAVLQTEKQSATTKDETNRPPKCPEGWLDVESNCYYVSSNRTNYFNAQISCEALGATVASIRSLRVQTELTVALGCSTRAWIGMEMVRPCITDSTKSFCWMWMDGNRDQSYSAWAAGHPSGERTAECAYTQGQWKSTNCWDENVYICLKKM